MIRQVPILQINYTDYTQNNKLTKSSCELSRTFPRYHNPPRSTNISQHLNAIKTHCITEDVTNGKKGITYSLLIPFNKTSQLLNLRVKSQQLGQIKQHHNPTTYTQLNACLQTRWLFFFLSCHLDTHLSNVDPVLTFLYMPCSFTYDYWYQVSSFKL